jgi:transposase
MTEKTSGRPLRAVAEDLGVGLSTLGKWVGAEREAGRYRQMQRGEPPKPTAAEALENLWSQMLRASHDTKREADQQRKSDKDRRPELER